MPEYLRSYRNQYSQIDDPDSALRFKLGEHSADVHVVARYMASTRSRPFGVFMEHAGISNATARAKMAGSRQFGQVRAPVQFLTIDEMLAAIGEPDGRRVSLLKLDVEGYEFAEGLLEQVVAQSAPLTLCFHRPARP